jgi:GntR family transcriptional regulator
MALGGLGEVADRRVDLLAEEAGLAIGFHKNDQDAPVYLQITQLCIKAGANTALVSSWIEEGRRRAAAAKRAPSLAESASRQFPGRAASYPAVVTQSYSPARRWQPPVGARYARYATERVGGKHDYVRLTPDLGYLPPDCALRRTEALTGASCPMAADVSDRACLAMVSPVRLAAMNIDPQSPEHPYKQVAAQLKEQIERGDIIGQLPSITVLTAQTGLAVGTVRRAIDILVKERLVQTVPGRGTFVKR